MNVAAVLIPTLILVSGLVAFIGNLVGRNIGRRRLSVLGLRPRYTAQIITVLTGMLITIVTLAAVLLVSNDARQALFHLHELQQQTQSLEAQITQQESELRALQVRDIAYQNDQEVLRTVVDGRGDPATVQRQVQAFFAIAAQAARQRGVAAGPDGAVVRMSPPGLTAADVAQDVVERHEPMVIRMIAVENSVRGAPLVATVIGFPNVLVFREGETIVARTIDGRGARQQIETGLLDLIADVAAAAKEHGIISPPFGRATGPPDVRIDPAIFLETLERVEARHSPVDVHAVALVDTYTIGPVLVTFR